MGDVVELFPGDDGGKALPKWAARLGPYLDAQGGASLLRRTPMPEFPWPHLDNPMVGYLIDRGAEIAAAEGMERALAWVAAHAWFEAVIDERAGL